jgi:hypothetical protein
MNLHLCNVLERDGVLAGIHHISYICPKHHTPLKDTQALPSIVFAIKYTPNNS